MADEQGKIITALADFLLFEFMAKNKGRLHIVNNGTEVLRVHADVLPLLEYAEGYFIQFDNLKDGKASILAQSSERLSRLAFIDPNSWSISLMNYDQWGSLFDGPSYLHSIHASFASFEGWQICLEMAGVPTVSELATLFPAFEDKLKEPEVSETSCPSGNSSAIIENTLIILGKFGDDWATSTRIRTMLGRACTCWASIKRSKSNIFK